MAFTIEDFEDLVRLLGEHPEWRERLRPLVLGEEFLRLPAAVDDLARQSAAQIELLQTLTAEVRALTARFEEQTARFAEITRRFERLEDRMDRLEGRFGNVEGKLLELQYADHVGAWFGRWLRRPRRVQLDDLSGLDQAAASGRVTEDELEELRSLDLVVGGTSKDGPGEDLLLAVEISQTINREDVERAAARAAILIRGGYTARGLVGGGMLSAAAAEAARERGVIIDLRRAST